jgi:hypothetical protein
MDHSTVTYMRLLVTIISIALLSGIAEYLFPWWTIAFVAFLVTAAAGLPSGRAFLAGFCGVTLLWLFVSLIIDFRNAHILSGRMAELFQLPHSFLFILVSAIVGGLVGGLAGWSGAVVRKNLIS